MLDIARESDANRRELFRATSQAMGVNEAIVEKDFWVCWILDYLFRESSWKDKLIFKGGTSLSKAYGIIERFSEDIDLVLDWSLIGTTEEDAWEDRSRKSQEAFTDKALEDTRGFLRAEMAVTLGRALRGRLGSDLKVEAEGMDVLIGYPRAFSLASIQPQIRLEIGPRSRSAPNEIRQITSYAADQFAEKFKVKDVSVKTLAVELTFWEKAMILHKEANRPADSPTRSRLSRHYYDFYRLSNTPILASALAQSDLLANVVDLNKRFFYRAWARDQEALAGKLKLVPPEARIEEITRDYRSMQEMLFGDVPSFGDILERLRRLEVEINERLSLKV